MTNPKDLVDNMIALMAGSAAITAIVPSVNIMAFHADNKQRSLFERLRNMTPPEVLVSWELTGPPTQNDLHTHTLSVDVRLETEALNMDFLTAFLGVEYQNVVWFRRPQSVHANVTKIAAPVAQRRPVPVTEFTDIETLHISINLSERC